MLLLSSVRLVVEQVIVLPHDVLSEIFQGAFFQKINARWGDARWWTDGSVSVPGCLPVELSVS